MMLYGIYDVLAIVTKLQFIPVHSNSRLVQIDVSVTYKGRKYIHSYVCMIIDM